MKPAAWRPAPRSRSRQVAISSGSRVSTIWAGPAWRKARPPSRASSRRTNGAALPAPACQMRAGSPSAHASGESCLVTSVFDLFKIGVGPSSSHTMGPMTAACRFVETLSEKALLHATARVQVDLYGSLALTGKGHATDRAILIGLSGKRPDGIDPDEAERTVAHIRESGRIALAGKRDIAFDEARDLKFLQRERLPHHSNGMRFGAFDGGGRALESRISYSVGGGAIVDEEAIARNAPPEGAWDLPY